MIRLLILLLFVRTVYCKDIVSAEEHNMHEERRDKHLANLRTSNRRFVEDMDDQDWHISHLKDTDFARRTECADDTFEDKVNKYRRALKNDGALVEYVYADPLPFKEADLLKSKVCKAPKSIIDVIDTTHIFNDDNHAEDVSTTNIPETETQNLSDTKETKQPLTEEVNSATTVKAQSTLTTNHTADNTTDAKGRRAGEYVFSSVEYYDEVSDFDDSLCPHAVEVIVLEIDQLRNYDIECENTLEWRSLD